ncbi:hypothetical protein Dimus_012520 [Dionaea muscipula]
MVIGNLTNLRELHLDYVFINSIFPPLMTNLSSLSSLSLSNCNLFGEFPVEILNLPHPRTLFLGDNNGLHANFSLLPSWSSPLELWNITERILMSDNHFVGELPSSVNTSKLSYLTYLSMSDNQLSGVIPSWLFTLPSLNTLSLHENHFVGELPSSVNTSKLSYLTYLDPSNQLSGAIPYWLFTLTSLNTLSLGENQFTSLSGFAATNTSTSLQVLHLQSNQLQGSIPADSIFSLLTLTGLSLQRNNFSDTVNLSLNPWNNMEQLSLDFNMFEGQFPILPPLMMHFTASNNRFSGYLPSSFYDSVVLQVLDLSNNNLVGEIPLCFENLTNNDFFKVLDLHSNSIVDILPPIFGQCSSLST